jgi:hypothetical protein
VRERRGCVVVATVVGVEDAPDDLELLVRHRPCSISRT